jgi:hypothetical protein
MTNIFNKLTQIFLLFFLTNTVILAAPASDGLINFGGFADGGNNLTNTDFVLSGTINGVAGNMDKDSTIAFLVDRDLVINKACVYRLEANGTTTGSFELTAISANEYDEASDDINVSLVGIKLDTTEIFSDNTIAGDTNAKDTYDTATLAGQTGLNYTGGNPTVSTFII